MVTAFIVYNELILQLTVPDGPPLNIQGSGVDGMPGQVSISWQPPQLELRNGEITGYRINCPGSTPATTNQLNTIVSVQRAATRYTCLVAAATDVGPGVSGSVEVLSGTIYYSM